MGILAWLIFGALVGWVASKIMNTDAQQGGIANILVGVLGALIGGLVSGSLGSSGITGFNLASFLWALAGAIILLVLYKSRTKRRTA